MEAKALLREHGFRATPAKLYALEILRRSGRPMTISEVRATWKGRKPDQATLYRMLNDLTTANVVRRIDLNSGTAHFEYTPDSPHHHHIICTSCGTIEDVERCMVTTKQSSITRGSEKFKSIQYHTLDFFGLCNDCIK